MSIALLFAIIVLAVFVGAFLSARRFGVLALGLSAGSVLSALWSDWLSVVLRDYSLDFAWLPSGVLAVTALLLLPMLMLLMSGPKYSKKLSRVVSSLAIGILTAAFLVVPLGKYMVLEGEAMEVYNLLSDYWQYVVTVGLAIGVVDLFMSHSKKASFSDKKH